MFRVNVMQSVMLQYSKRMIDFCENLKLSHVEAGDIGLNLMTCLPEERLCRPVWSRVWVFIELSVCFLQSEYPNAESAFFELKQEAVFPCLR